MRVISGKYKGRKLQGFNVEGTRPTMDRVKESMFAMIQNQIKNSKCLDLFAGSGSLGIEALSMGAHKCDFIDHNPEAIKNLRQNTKGIEGSAIINSDYKKYLKTTKEKYNVIFLDPPYKNNLLNKSLKFIKEYDLLEENGIIVCEYEFEDPICDFNLIKEKNYGSKKIKIFEK